MFAKVFASLWQGSMVGKADMQLVFIYMLANCTASGEFNQTPEVMAALTGLPVERVEEAIAALEAPDPRSRNSSQDGRRIVRLDDHRDWGWQIVNYSQYRENRDGEKRRVQTREATKRWREKSTTVNDCHAHGEQNDDENAHGEPESCSHRLTVSRNGSQMLTVSHGEPKQKQKQKEKKIEPAGFESYLPAIAEAIDNSPDPDTARRLARYLHDSGTTETTDILAVLDHWTANHRTIGKPLAYYAAERPARSAIVMQHRMDAEMARHQLVKRAGHA